MKKNNKGFTLIELMAVIVIMGILSIIVIPRISDLVLETKEEIYVQDAKKLLTQAQYRMNSNSVDIDKPEMDECIVFSLKYLNINDFRSPPNNGTYMDESSFVVVRNVDGDYQYAVMLLEHRKDGLYQGVEFVTEKQLNARDAIKHVRYFEPRDIRYIDPDVSEKAGGDYIDTQYINSQLAKSGVGQAKWVEDNSIVGTYNEMAMKEGLVADASSPKFTAKITSDEERDEIGTIYAVLTISASDGDDALNTLTVCTKIADRDDLDYPVNSLTPELCENYGDRKYFVKNIDFAQYGFNNRDKTLAYVYVTVMDPGGNVTRKLIEYNIHQNPGPRIKQMVLTKRSEDKQNLPTATLQVNVWDDLFSVEQLMVCFNQDIDEETCQGEFKPYNEVFDSNNQLNYTFKDSNGVNMVNPDGSNHTLTMFVKNPDDLISKKTAEYLIYINKDPVINSFSVIPDTIDGFNSLYYHVELDATDDFDVGNLMVRLGNEEPIRYVEFRNKESNARDKAIHRAPGLFDGKDREIVVKVWDQYQKEEDAIFTNAFITNVYLNEPPYVSEATITSSGKICMEGGNCASNVDASLGGAYSANVKVKAADSLLSDIRSFKDNVQICISEDYSYCAEHQKDHFVDYTENLTYKFSSPTGDDMYGQPDTRHLYIALLEKEVYRDETNYYYSMSNGFEYKIYENQGPIITYHNEGPAFDVKTTEAMDDHVKKVNINFDNMVINDDFTYYTLQYCYTIDGGNPICTDSLSRTDFQNTFRKPFTFVNADGSDLGLMNGQEIVSYVVVTDHQGKEAKSGEVTYKLMTDQKPSIEEVTLGSDNIEFNSKNLRVSFKVLDVGDTFTVCFKEKLNDNDTCGPDDYTITDGGTPFSGDRRGTETSFYAISYSGKHWNYKNNPNTKTFIFSVKDSQGKVTDYSEQHSDPLTYDLYIACQPGNVTIGNISYYPKDTQSAINITNCSGKCYHFLPTIPINSSLYSQVNGYSSIYNKHMDNIVDNFLNNTDDLCPAIDEDETKYCNYESCFNHDSTVINPLFIGISELPENPTPYTVYLSGQFQREEVNEQCPSLINSGKLLFSKSDNRCGNPDEVCYGYDDVDQCKRDLEKFCTKDDSEAMYAVSCADATGDDIVRRTCKREYLNGDCYESASTCTEEDHCTEKCYKPIDCAEHIVTINNPTITCNKGVYSIYKAKSISNLEQGKIALVHVYPSTCPEALEAFPEYYAYDPNSSTPFVWFNLDELRENTTINVDVYFNGSE